MTEIAPAGTQVPHSTPEDKLGTIGLPMPGLEMKIVDTEDAGRDPAQQAKLAKSRYAEPT